MTIFLVGVWFEPFMIVVFKIGPAVNSHKSKIAYFPG